MLKLLSALLALTPISLSPRDLTGQSQLSDPLVGIWAAQTTVSPVLRGELVVTRNGPGWSASIGSVSTPFRASGDSIRFSLAGDLGRFRGVVAKDNAAISGWWIQPTSLVYGNPMATTLTLQRTGPNSWRGEVTPVEERYTLFLVVNRTPSGSLNGAFRNPQLNQRGGASQLKVTRAGDSVFFTARPDTTQPEIRHVAVWDSAARQLTLYWPPLGQTLVLTPRREDQAIELFPRLPRAQRYTYSPPPSTNDGWKVASARAVGFDETKLQTLVQRIADTLPTPTRAPFIHSLLVARHGKLVLEEYFAGYDRDVVHDIRSAGKTFASVMLGAAMLQGVRVTPATPIAPLLAREWPVANPDPRKQNITLAHLMTHTSGLACDDNDNDSPGNEGTMQSQTAQPDWWKYILDLPMKYDPGTHYAYCSGGSNLVGGAVAVATKTWLPELFDRTIARPLQFGRYYYDLQPTLEGYTGGGVLMRPRDLLKIGQLYLDGGVWNGKRIVSQPWVNLSTAKHFEWPYQNENVSAGSDGYAWHLNTLKSGTRTYREYEANGNGGQLLMVMPELDLVVVFTAGNYQGGGVWGRFRDDLVPNAIIPAIRN
jgi:CubicO group peptidase (beta-lactamase class C family)